MPDIFTLDDVDDEFRNIFGMIANAFDGLGDKKQVQTGRNGARVFHHVSDELTYKSIEFLVNQIVLFEDSQSNRCIQASETIQRFSQQA